MTVQSKVRIAVNGYGVIGKRVADAVTLQPDMELVGVADIVSDYRIRVTVEHGYPVFASTPEARAEMEAAGIPVAGGLDDLVGRADVMADCTPKRVAAANRARYQAGGVKVIWQGGEKHEIAGYSFVAQVNYAGALDREAARVVSCAVQDCIPPLAGPRSGWSHGPRGGLAPSAAWTTVMMGDGAAPRRAQPSPAACTASGKRNAASRKSDSSRCATYM